MGVDCSKFSGPIIPVIYNINLRDPAGYFLAANFEIRNKDVIFTANAASVEVTKFLNFLRTIMATANDPIVYATNYYTLINTAKGIGTSIIVNTPTPIPAVALRSADLNAYSAPSVKVRTERYSV